MYETIISVELLNTLMKELAQDLVVVDCRFTLADPHWGKREYDKAHIPGAIYAHVNNDLSGPVSAGMTGRHPLPDKHAFLEWVQNAGITNQKQVIVYDQSHGGMAARLWWLMRWIGHQSVAVVDGGWAAWQKAGFPTESTIPHPARATYSPAWKDDLMIAADDVQKWSSSRKHTLVDSREARRYSGVEENIDPVAGHIKGAVNMPYVENNNGDGTWKSKDVLQARFNGLLNKSKSDEIAFYCGSGVTACQNVLAFKHAGLGDARLYPGSWSEWITDERRPIEVGE